MANRYIESTTPWVLAKQERAGDAEAGRRLDVVLGALVDTVRLLAEELRPFVPATAERLAHHAGSGRTGEVLPTPEPVFPRLDIPVEAFAPSTDILAKVPTRA